MRRETEISSMDLLLDTICNAFGGIVFIALLLAILSRAAGPPQPLDAATARLLDVDLQTEARTLEREIHSLERVLQEMMASDSPTQHIPDRATDIDVLDTLETELARLNSLIESVRDEQREIAADLRTQERATAQLADQLRELSDQRWSPVPVVHETRRLPRSRPIARNLRQFFIVVREGRFVPISSVDFANTRRGEAYNTRFVHLIRGPLEADFLDPIVHAGSPVDQALRRGGLAEQTLSRLNPQQHMLHFFISTDSFGEFNQLKAYFLERGFSYYLGFSEGAFQLTPGTVQTL